MKILRFDSIGGASGDIILGGLIKLGANIDVITQQLKTVMTDDYFKIELSDVVEQGITGVRAKVLLKQDNNMHEHCHSHAHSHEHSHHSHEDIQEHEHNHGHSHNHHHHHAPHRTYADIEKMILKSELNDNAKDLACKIFKNLAIAEGAVHGKDYKDVHFHEVGATDSIVDIVGIAIAFDLLKIDKIIVSPLPLGQGTLKCEHGLMPIPAPATAELLKNSPCILTDEPFELVTPTGAAVLTSLPKINSISEKQPLNIEQTVNSFGQRKLNNRINMLRLVLINEESAINEGNYNIEDIYKLSCNIDDMTPEHLGNVQQKLLDAGALDVYCENILMKKQRLAVKLTVLCDLKNKEKFILALFQETTSLGIRIELIQRATLPRDIISKQTSMGELKVKQSFLNDRVITKKIEFSDLEKIASDKGISIKELQLKLNDLLD